MTQCRAFKPMGRSASSGFALVPALFLIVVLAGLAVVAVRLGSAQQQTVTMALLQARTLSAARAGVEWGAYQAISGASCVASTTLNLTEATLNGYAVTVTCTSTSFTSGTGTAHSYVITSTAITGSYGQPGYVRRVMGATLTDAT